MFNTRYIKTNLSPKRLIDDIKFKRAYNKAHPNEFDCFGTLCFGGEQGSGKSQSGHRLVKELLKRFPQAKVISNTTLNYCDYIPFTGIDCIDENDNGENGLILFIDEFTLEFGNMQRDDNLNEDWLYIIQMQRKRHLLTIALCPCLSRISKIWREQFDLICICEPLLFGHLQHNVYLKNKVDTLAEEDEKDKYAGLKVVKNQFFWRSPIDYANYNSYEIIKPIDKDLKKRIKEKSKKGVYI